MEQSIEEQIVMFGITTEELSNIVKDSMYYSMGSLGMLAMTHITDAQNAMEINDTKTAVQSLNKAKWIISRYNIHVRPTTKINYDEVVSTLNT